MTSVYKLFPALCLALCSFFLSAQTISWQPLNGPNGAYNVLGLTSDADGRLFMYAVGNIYKSTDQGDNWAECITGISQPTATFRKFLRAASGAFYVQFDNSSGKNLYRYEPASNSWALVPFPFGNSDVDGIDFDNQGHLWVSRGGSNSVLSYSTNEGQSFQQVTSAGQITGWFDFLATFNDANNLIAVSYGTNQKVFHFTSTGTVQQVISGRGAKYLGYNPSTGTAFYRDSDNSKRSTDGGLNWQIMELQPGGSQVSFSKMYFDPSGRIWVQASGGVLFYSDDDGLNWTKQTLLAGYNDRLFRTDDNIWFTASNCTNLQFSRSKDMGASWTDLSQQLKLPRVQSIQKDAAANLYALTCTKSAYEISPDGGQTWTDFIIKNGSPVSVRVHSLAVRPDGLMLAIGSNSKYYRSFDNGASWSELTMIVNPSPASTLFQNFYIDRKGVCYLNRFSGPLLRSTDSGNSWQILEISLHHNKPVFHPNGDIYFLDGTFAYHYHADGDSISGIEVPNESFYAFFDMHCTHTGAIYFCGSGTSPGPAFTIYRMADGNSIPELLSSYPGGFPKIVTSNVEGDIFVVDENALFKSDDAGNTWIDLGPLPGNISNTIYVSPDQYLYMGYSGDVVYRSAEPVFETNFITGRIWLDNNGDCTYDPGEIAVPTSITASGNGNYTAFSGYNGNYTLSAPSGTYSLNVWPPNALYAPCFSDVPLNLNGPNDSSTVDMPFQAVAQCPYLSVNLSTPILRRCFDVTYTVFYKNEGTAPAPNAYVTVTLDPFFVFQNSSLPIASQNGQDYTFNLGTLAARQTGFFKISVKVSCDATLSQTHCISAHIFPDGLCLPALVPRANYEECRENIGAFDPNDKRAFVNGQEEPGLVSANTEIEYLIRFQNTGTDTAFRVVVEDRLPGTLDLSSLTPIGASHPYTLELRDQRVLRFVFENILLPDSNINEAASHGFIKFQVAQQPNLPNGALIRNAADIFFDFNAPVRTNDSKLTVGTVHSQPVPGNPHSVTAWPNPFESSISFKISGPELSSSNTLRLFDPLGREVQRAEFRGKTLVLPRLNLEAGLYYFLIESGGRRLGMGKVLAR